jgi:NADH-quinone oxidoreductase subunit E
MWRTLVLSEKEIELIREERGHYPHAQAAVPEALRIVQRSRGWVSDEAVKDIGALLEVSAADVDGVATFYNLIFRKPVGRHVILCCDSVSCWLTGSDGVGDRLAQRLGIRPGETTADGRFTLLPTACLGACDRGPVLMVDEDLHVRVTPEAIDAILEGYK